MPTTTINFADVESFEPVPEGEYAVEIEKVELRSNKAGDGTYLNWEFMIIDGDYENRRLWMITSLKPTALFRLKQVFEELGVLEDEEIEIETDDDVEVSTSGGPRLLEPDLDGVECVVVVKNEIYDGKERNRVEEVYDEDVRSKKSKKRKKSSANEDTAKSNKREQRKSRKRREEPEDDYDEDEDDDDEEEEEAPRRRRRSSSTRASGSKRRRVR